MQQPRAFCRAPEWQLMLHPNLCPEPSRKTQPPISKPFPARFRDLRPKTRCSRPLDTHAVVADGHAVILAAARGNFPEELPLSSRYRRAAAPGFERLFAPISASALVSR